MDRWCAFWFTPEPAYTLGLVRMAFGVLSVAWAITALPDVRGVFSKGGAVPQYLPRDYQWSVFHAWPGDTALLIGWGLLLLSAIALTLGWHARVAAILVFVLLYSFLRRGAYIYNTGDSLMVIIALFLAFSSCGAALSLDQRRRSGSFWSAMTLAPWPIRLLQVQLTLIYVFAAQTKLAEPSWVNGSSLFYAWHTEGRWVLLRVPEWLSTNAVLVNAATWAAVITEIAIALLVWNRRCRPWVLAIGVLLHLAMMLTLSIGYFSFAVYVVYLAFVPWQVVQSLPAKLKARWLDRPRRSASAPTQPVNGAGTP